MRPIVTIDGIDQALLNLQYSNKNALKYRLMHAIRDYYNEIQSIESINEIDTDELVKTLWDTGNDHNIIRNRRKNFNSVKSTVNADLNQLYKDGNNPEGIIINSNNVFDMSDEAKSEFLESFSYNHSGKSHIPLGQIADVLKVVNNFLTNKDSSIEDDEKLDQLKEIIKEISSKIGASEDENSNVEYGEEDLTGIGDLYSEEEVQEEPEDEIEEIIDEEEPEDDLEEIEDDEDLEELEVEEEPEDEIEEIIDDEEPEDDLEELEDDEDLEELELDEEPEDEIEEIIDDEEPEDDIDEVEDDEDLEELELEDLEDEADEIEDDEDLQDLEMVYTLQDLLDEYGDEGYQDEDGIRKAKYLADEFDEALSAMDKYYNQYILIPKGRYKVGRKQSEKNENSIQKVKLKEFYFGKFPVTNNLFEIFVEKTGYVTTAEKVGYGTVYKGRYQRVVDQETGMESLNWSSSLIAEKVNGACWYQPNGPESNLHGKRNHPVVQVSLKDALSFAAWTGKRLPNEHEWEAATRTSKGYEYPWGKKFKENICNIESSFVGDTTPVDKYKKNINRYEIFDAIGNVLEWTRDKINISESESLEIFEYIVKGGSWISGDNVRLSDRLLIEADHTSNILGFRCVAY